MPTDHRHALFAMVDVGTQDAQTCRQTMRMRGARSRVGRKGIETIERKVSSNAAVAMRPRYTGQPGRGRSRASAAACLFSSPADNAIAVLRSARSTARQWAYAVTRSDDVKTASAVVGGIRLRAFTILGSISSTTMIRLVTIHRRHAHRRAERAS